MGSKSSTAYHTHSAPMTCVADWRAAMCVDLNSQLTYPNRANGTATAATPTPTPVSIFPKVLIQLISDYLQPTYADLMRCTGWVATLNSVPASIAMCPHVYPETLQFTYTNESRGVPSAPSNTSETYRTPAEFKIDLEDSLFQPFSRAMPAATRKQVDAKVDSVVNVLLWLVRTAIDDTPDINSAAGTSSGGVDFTSPASPLYRAPNSYVLRRRFMTQPPPWVDELSYETLSDQFYIIPRTGAGNPVMLWFRSTMHHGDAKKFLRLPNGGLGEVAKAPVECMCRRRHKHDRYGLSYPNFEPEIIGMMESIAPALETRTIQLMPPERP